MKIYHSFILLICLFTAAGCRNVSGPAKPVEASNTTQDSIKLDLMSDPVVFSFNENDFDLLEKFSGNNEGFDSVYDLLQKKYIERQMLSSTVKPTEKRTRLAKKEDGTISSWEATNLGEWHEDGQTGSYNIRAAFYFPERVTTLIVKIPLRFKKSNGRWDGPVAGKSSFMLISPFNGQDSVLGAPFVNILPWRDGYTNGDAGGSITVKKPFDEVKKFTRNGEEIIETSHLNQVVLYHYDLKFEIPEFFLSKGQRPVISVSGNATFSGSGVPVK